ncbi:PAS/PAC sensor signal transduction histidine kinase [Fibrisoma limi BUZ 3]|uniref:histidine kinase n=1 Tax=Fibrisoma limi BUZ 3 TaxID=1185876 RepID=I2GMW5_9BACT|nr:ATP-binding protein [Fibrisoma limi]CCH55243.1 PAS/PAC sensor signal transduction histidine kinase [Fibrisoma limi BUZ 3]
MYPLTLSSELLLESVFQTSLNGILVCRAIRDGSEQIVDFDVIRCNSQAAVLTGFTEEQILNNSMLTLDPDGCASGIFEQYVNVVHTGRSVRIEHYFEGGNVWLLQALTKFEDGVLVSMADVTATKLVEQQRLNEQALFQTVLDYAQTGIAVMDAVRDESGRIIDFVFTHINEDAERITKRSRAELIGQRYSQVWPGATTNGVLSWHIHVAESGEPVRLNGMNYPVGDYDGWYNVRIRPYGKGVVATFVDVTALKKAELAKEKQAELLRSVLDNSSSLIIAFEAVRDPADGRIVDFRYVAQNEASRQSVSRTDEQVIGHTMLEYFPHVIETGLFNRYLQVIETGQSMRFEQEYNYDQLTGWFEISVMKWGDGIVLTLVDITASKRHQQEIEAANLGLQRANDNLQQFAYVASHDLQEPLRKITAFSDVLVDQYADVLDDSGKDIVQRMQSAAGRMSELIRDVLAYSRVSTHRESFRRVSLTKVLADVVRELNPEQKKANITVDVDRLPEVLGDQTQLYQLFENLLSNAIKFQPPGQSAVVRINCRAVMGADVSVNGQSSFCEISVQDNGIGFDPKYADRIFQVFQRLHTRQQYAGTGVGLAICKRVIENHNGVIYASSQPGRGATFRVYLPTLAE